MASLARMHTLQPETDRFARLYDPFLGSGTTLTAAETTCRDCYAVDIDPRYVDVAIQRWQNLSGKAAVLAGAQAFSSPHITRSPINL